MIPDGSESGVWEELLGNDALVKRVLRSGNGNRPEYKQTVTVALVGKTLPDGREQVIPVPTKSPPSPRLSVAGAAQRQLSGACDG